MINNIKLAKTAVICLFVLISISIILSYIVFGGTATGSFLVGQNAPNDPTVMLQQADAACGGDSFDTTTTNLTTHMLNATLNWTEADSNGDSVWTFVCIATTRSAVDNANSTNKTSGDGCNIINFWNWTVDGPVYGPINNSKLGIRLNNASGGSAVNYNGDKNVYYGAMMAYDNQTTSNTSNKVYFNITILNNIPSVSGFNTTRTHIRTPNLGWNYADTDDGSAADKCPSDLAKLNFSLFIGSAVSGNGSFVHELNNITGNYSWTASPLNWNSTNNNGWSNETYYYRVNVTDFNTGTVSTNLDGTFYLYDNLPNVPFGFNVTQTHNQSMHVAWNGGTETDSDTVTYSITAGTTANGTEILTYTTQATSNKSDNFFATTIPWNKTVNLGFANTTVFMVIGAYDSASGVRRNNYTASFMLYDNLPDVVNVSMSDNNALLSYTYCNTVSCAFNPVSGINITLAVNITTNDPDSDCDAADYGKTILYLCLNSTNLAGCGDNTNNNYTIPVDSVTKIGTICEWKFNTNLTNITPQFFIPSGNYLYHINATSQSGARSTLPDIEKNGSWVYGSLQSVNFPSSVTVGDGSIQLETWNPGLTAYTMTNYGNIIMFTQWNSTDFTRAGATNNWTLRGWDFLLDNDNDVASQTGKIPYLNITNTTAQYFNYSTGLQLCITKNCDDVSLNETMATYWHINPVSGLGAGTYSATITYVLKTS